MTATAEKTARDASSTPRISLEHGSHHSIEDTSLEKSILRKFDRFVLPQFMVLILVAYIDRSNIGAASNYAYVNPRADINLAGNARIFGFEDGIRISGRQFNDISTVFYATYVLFEIPWVMAVKKFGARTVLAIAMIAWSIVTLCTGFVQNYTQCIVMRLLLGAAEAGLFPALTFLISTIWDRKNQAKRVSLLYMSSALSGAFGGLLAYAIQSMGRQRGLDAWRWLFVSVTACSNRDSLEDLPTKICSDRRRGRQSPHLWARMVLASAQCRRSLVSH